MSFLTKLNWKNYESYFKDMGVKDASFFIYNINSYNIKLI